MSQPSQQHGCQHYLRKCHLLSPCCQNYYQCRLCHDQHPNKTCKVLKMDRHAVQTIRCDLCHHQQHPTQYCQHCHIQFSDYFCKICNLYTSLQKPVYHCDQCGLCRNGNIDERFHCDQCNGDFHISLKSSHTNCRQDGFKQNCFLCLDYLFDSTQACTRLDKCGHYVHVHCFKQYLKQGFQNCPICSQSLTKESDQYISQMDQLIEATKYNMPDYFKNKKLQILCNNCMQKTQDVPFNFYGLKCGSCGSYNTKQYI